MRPYMAAEPRMTIAVQQATIRDHRSDHHTSPWVARFIGGGPTRGTMLDIAFEDGRDLPSMLTKRVHIRQAQS